MSFRDRIDMAELLEVLGIEARRRGHKLVAKCPNPEHLDTSPSWQIVDDPGTHAHGGHHCFSCKFGGGPWELVMAVRGVDEEQAAEFIGALVGGKPQRAVGVPQVTVRMPAERREYQLPPQVRIPSIDGDPWPAPFLAYLNARGVTEDQRRRWSMGFATRGVLAWRVVIPVRTRGRLVAHVARAIFDDGSERYHMPRERAGASPAGAIFGEPAINPASGVLTIAEGSFSMLALERAQAPNPIAILGSDWSAQRVAILTRHRWERVLVATDPDFAGERVAKAIEASFRFSQVSRLRLDRSPDDEESDVLRERWIEALSK